MLKILTVPSLLVLGALLVVAPVTDSHASDVATCNGCHGANGASTIPSVPVIAGFSGEYFKEAMGNYKNGARPCREMEVPAGPQKGTVTDMCKATGGLSDANIQALASHYESQKFIRAKQEFNAALAEKGAAIHKQNCEKCHSSGGTDPLDDASILAGQWKPYLRQEITDYRTGARQGDDRMTRTLKALSESDIDALLDFYASK